MRTSRRALTSSTSLSRYFRLSAAASAPAAPCLSPSLSLRPSASHRLALSLSTPVLARLSPTHAPTPAPASPAEPQKTDARNQERRDTPGDIQIDIVHPGPQGDPGTSIQHIRVIQRNCVLLYSIHVISLFVSCTLVLYLISCDIITARPARRRRSCRPSRVSRTSGRAGCARGGR